MSDELPGITILRRSCTIALTSDAPSAEVAAALRELHRVTRHPAIGAVARWIAAPTGGRPEKPDATALGEMAALLEAGTARSVEQAAGFVAAALKAEQSHEAAVRRLARKFRGRKKVRTKGG